MNWIELELNDPVLFPDTNNVPWPKNYNQRFVKIQVKLSAHHRGRYPEKYPKHGNINKIMQRYALDFLLENALDDGPAF